MGSKLSATLPADWATVDMIAQFSYCPRRFHLMYVEGRWKDNVHTVKGRTVHRRVDRIDHLLPEASKAADHSETLSETDGEAEEDPPPEIARSVSLGCEDLKLLGKLDLVSADPEGGEAVPVETKKGRVPPTPERSYPPERAQLMAQGLLLRAHGYRSTHGYVYYVASRSRVRIEFTGELEAETREIIAAVQSGRSADRLPAPLEDSPKCWGCSLCGICLPDETNALRASSGNSNRPAGADVRRLFAARDRAIPFYVQEQGARVGKRGKRLIVTKAKKSVGEARLIEISQLVLMGNVQVSAQALHLLMQRGLPVVHFSTGGWFHGISHGINIENAYSRSAQFAAAAEPTRCAAFARKLVETKVANQRALLMRNGSGSKKTGVVNELARQLKLWRRPGEASQTSLAEILGLEGQAAALYFSVFATMLKTGELEPFHFNSRNRRPPLGTFSFQLPQPKTTARPGERLAVFCLRFAGERMRRRPLGRRPRPLVGLLPPASVRAPRARAGSNGAVSSGHRGQCCDHRHQHWHGRSKRLYHEFQRLRPPSGRPKSPSSCLGTPSQSALHASNVRLPLFLAHDPPHSGKTTHPMAARRHP